MTYVVECPFEIKAKGYIWNLLKQYYSDEIIESIKGMKILKSMKGVVFDIPSKFEIIFSEIGKTLNNDNFNVFKANELPEFIEN